MIFRLDGLCYSPVSANYIVRTLFVGVVSPQTSNERHYLMRTLSEQILCECLAERRVKHRILATPVDVLGYFILIDDHPQTNILILNTFFS